MVMTYKRYELPEDADGWTGITGRVRTRVSSPAGAPDALVGLLRHDFNSLRVLHWIFSPLVALNNESLEPRPLLAAALPEGSGRRGSLLSEHATSHTSYTAECIRNLKSIVRRKSQC